MNSEKSCICKASLYLSIIGFLAICIVLESREASADEDMIIDNVTVVDVVNKKLLDGQRITINDGKKKERTGPKRLT